MKQFLTDQVNDRLKTALGAGVETPSATETGASNSSEAAAVENIESDPDVETTLEELEAYQIVKAIAVAEAKPQRIVHRDAKTYFAVLLDDNNRKPVARLHFNTKLKYVGIFDEDKKETRHPIESLDDIYRFADEIRETVKRYL